MLQKNQIYFSDPNDFNDPFDCLAQESMHENYIEDLVRCSASERFGVPFAEITDHQFNVVELEFNSEPELRRLKKQVENEIDELKLFGVLSLTERNDSILMWSHYSDSHKGFCIGFNSMPECKLAREVRYVENIDKFYLQAFYARKVN